MPKFCKSDNCGNFVFGGGYCKFHQFLRLDTQLRTLRSKAVNKISIKLRKLTIRYTKLRAEFLKDHPLCDAKLKHCTRIATDIHHMKGRGKFLLNILTWLPVCRECHRYIEEHPYEAKQLGLSESRLK